MPIAEGALHPLIAVWDGKAADARREAGAGRLTQTRASYLMGKADAFQEAATVLGRVLDRHAPGRDRPR